MRLTVRLFAGLKERAGASTLDVELAEPATVADLMAAVPFDLPDRSYIVAINRVYADAGAAIVPGDEVALIPPVSGGEDVVREARITDAPLDLSALAALVRDPRAGALVTFEGVTREVSHLDYEAYAEMAEPMLRSIAGEEAERHGLTAIAVVHRIGRVPLSEASVIVAASGPHRGETFAGARAVIDRLKDEAPIFKREEGEWIEGTLPSPDRLEQEGHGQPLDGQGGEQRP